jgi:hypothetical protein
MGGGWENFFEKEFCFFFLDSKRDWCQASGACG